MARRPAPPPRPSPHPRYLDVKVAELEFRLARQAAHAQLLTQIQREFDERFQQALQPLLARRAAQFRAAGLDSTKQWQLDDVTQTIVEVQG
jgi:hypothetical protein